MPWFKVDDNLHDHRKAHRAGKAAMGVWVMAGSWSMDNDTDGFIPTRVLSRWGSRVDAARLVASGLWDEVEKDGESGWVFHDWARFQPSAAVTAAKKAAEHEAGVRGNHNRWHKARGISDPDCEYCHRVPDQEPDGAPDAQGIGGGESAPIPPVPVPIPHTVPNGTARPTAQTFVAEWIEHSQQRPPSDIIGQVSKRLKVLVDDGIEPTVIRRGLAEWDRRNLHPSVLPSIVHEAQKAKAQATITRLPRFDELEEPPSGLSPAEYAAWDQAQREKRQGR